METQSARFNPHVLKVQTSEKNRRKKNGIYIVQSRCFHLANRFKDVLWIPSIQAQDLVSKHRPHLCKGS